jgi:hypothetical protein
MRPKLTRTLLTILCVSAMYLLPVALLSFVKQVLEVMVVLHLVQEVLHKMQG